MTSAIGTFVFTDLVGSTALTSSLEDAAAEELRATHFELLRGAVAAAGGIEVKTLGDGLMVMFTSASRAVACAVGMQQAIEQHNRRAAHPLSVRIGLATGEAMEEDNDYFGDAVVEAARLCDLADGGQILATGVVRSLLGRHATYEIASVGHRELKGLPGATEVVEVRWEPAAPAGGGHQLPLPRRLVGAMSEALFGFFGREEELEQIAVAAKRADSDGQLQVVFVAGEPGIGKTALTAQAARRAHATGATVLYGACDEGVAVPYRPWISALRPLADALTNDVLGELSGLHRSVLTRLLPSLVEGDGAEPTEPADPETERFWLFEAVLALLAAAAGQHELFIVLDDLHWADEGSLQLLRHLVVSAAPLH